MQQLLLNLGTDRRYINFIAGLLILLGGIGWFGGAFLGISGGRGVATTVELPLGDLNSLAVDSHGHIYVGLGFYSRVQQYDNAGRFLRSWPIDAGGGPFRLRVNEQDEIEVATARTNGYFRFNSTGKLLEGFLSEDDADDQMRSFPDLLRVKVADGTIYVARRLLLFPAIRKEHTDGSSITLVSVPFYKWVLMGPFPASLFWFIAILLLNWKDGRMQRKSSVSLSHTGTKEP